MIITAIRCRAHSQCQARASDCALGALEDRYHDPQFIHKENKAQKGQLWESWSGRSWDSNPDSAKLLASTQGSPGECLQSDAGGKLAQSSSVLLGTREHLTLFSMKDQFVLILAFPF